MEPDLQICKRANRRHSASPERRELQRKDRATAEATAGGARRRSLAYTKVFRKRSIRRKYWLQVAGWYAATRRRISAAGP